MYNLSIYFLYNYPVFSIKKATQKLKAEWRSGLTVVLLIRAPNLE